MHKMPKTAYTKCQKQHIQNAKNRIHTMPKMKQSIGFNNWFISFGLSLLARRHNNIYVHEYLGDTFAFSHDIVNWDLCKDTRITRDETKTMSDLKGIPALEYRHSKPCDHGSQWLTFYFSCFSLQISYEVNTSIVGNGALLSLPIRTRVE